MREITTLSGALDGDCCWKNKRYLNPEKTIYGRGKAEKSSLAFISQLLF